MKQAPGGLTFGQTISTGSSSKVKLAQSQKYGCLVAVKIMKKKAVSEQKLCREIAFARVLKHPNLLGAYDVYETEDSVYIVEPYGDKGSLFGEIQTITLDRAISVFRQVIYGLEYLHNLDIVHKDLKPENIILKGKDEAMIGDFGLAEWIPSGMLQPSGGSPHYSAPEAIFSERYDGKSADIWSIGVVLYAMLAVSAKRSNKFGLCSMN